MKKYILVQFLLISYLNFFSQNNCDSIAFNKHEIGIDIKPIFIIYGAKYVNKPNWQLFYKHRLFSQFYYRFNVLYNKGQANNIYTEVFSIPLDSVNDALTYKKNITGKQFQLLSGLEYKFGKKRFKQFVGIDLGYIHFKKTDLSYYGTRNRADNHNPNDWSHDVSLSNNHLNPNNNNQDSIITYVESRYNGFIIKPVYGFEFHFSKKLFFSTQIGIPLNLITPSYREIINNNNINYSRKRYYEFDMKNILNNFSLVYSI